MRSLCLAIAVMLLSTPAGGWAEILDASFESPAADSTFGYHIFRPSESPWSFVGSAGVARPGWQSLAFSVPNGQQVGLLLGGDGGLDAGDYSSGIQQMLTGLTPRAPYQVNFYVGCPDSDRSIEPNRVIVVADGVEVGRVIPGSAFEQYTTSSFLASSSGSALLTFIGEDPNLTFNEALAFLDDVTVSSVPEPTAWFLIGILLPSAAVIRRRQRAG
jgi:hypothetical protein